MKPFLLKTGSFLIFLGTVYVCLTGIYHQNDALRSRWNQGIPNWIKDSNLEDHFEDFETFCQRHTESKINLILGSSTALHGIHPTHLGRAWYSLASRGQNPAASAIMLDLAKTISQNYRVEIDTVIVDVYPEFSQDWVYYKYDTYEHMALTLGINQLIQQGHRVFRGGGIRRFHNAVSHRLFGPERPSIGVDRIRGYEMHSDSAFNEAQPLAWDGILNDACIEAIQRLSAEEVTLIFLCPPVMHENHCKELNEKLSEPMQSIWLDANDNLQLKDSCLFFDDHHLNDLGAMKNTEWIKYQLQQN